MPLKPTNNGKFFAYEDQGNAKRTAIIYFRQFTEEGSKWKFIDCEYNLRQEGKSIEDWSFLKEVGERIEEKLDDLNEE